MPTDTADWLTPPIRINPAANLTALVPSGTNVLSLDDTSNIRVNDVVTVYGIASGSLQLVPDLVVVGVTPTQITLASPVTPGLGLPGGVVAVPRVVIDVPGSSAGVPVQIAQVVTGVSIGTRPVPMTWSQSLTFNAGQTPSLVQTPSSTATVVVTWIDMEIETNAATSFSSFVHVGGPSSGNKWNGLLAVPATAFANDRVQYQGLGIEFLPGEAVTLSCGTLGGSVFGAFSFGGYEF